MNEISNDKIETLLRKSLIDSLSFAADVIKNSYEVGIQGLSDGEAAFSFFNTNIIDYLESGNQQSLKQAIALLKSSAYEGYDPARHTLAMFYIKGEFVNKNITAAKVLLAESAGSGYAQSMYQLGYYLVSGEFFEKNLTEGLLLIEKAAIKENHTSSQASLGVFYMFAEYGIKRDYEKAIYWLHIASIQKHAKSCFLLSDLLSKLNYSDEKKKYDLMLSSAENGYADAQYNIGNFHFNKSNVNYDPEKSVYWFSKASENGHTSATYGLALAFMNGDGIVKNMDKAIELFKKGVHLKHAKSMHTLGMMYESGNGVEVDINMAYELYTEAVELGDVYAKVNLALIYINHSNDENLFKEAINLLEAARNENHPLADGFLKQING
ncbi:tetratricopeptide repeat protein [Enterobacter roggenkampii]